MWGLVGGKLDILLKRFLMVGFLILQDFERPHKFPKLCLKISTSEARIGDGIKSEEEEMFASDEVVKDFSLKHQETAPSLSCHTCGEEIDSEEFVNEEKLYCSEECMERETQSVTAMETTRRRVRSLWP